MTLYHIGVDARCSGSVLATFTLNKSQNLGLGHEYCLPLIGCVDVMSW